MRSLADKKFISDKFDASGHRDITKSYCILKYDFGKNYFTFPAQVYHINLAGSQLLFPVPGTIAVFTRMWKQERFLMRNNQSSSMRNVSFFLTRNQGRFLIDKKNLTSTQYNLLSIVNLTFMLGMI